AFEFCRSYMGRVSSVISLSGSFKDWSGSEAIYTDYERYMETLCHLVEENSSAAESLSQTLKNVFPGSRDAAFASPDAGHGELLKNVLGLVDDHIKLLVVEPFLTSHSIGNYARQ